MAPRERASSKSPAAMAPTTSVVTPKKVPLNPKTKHYEFSGPYVGPLAIMLGLPVLVWLFAYYCNDKGWPAVPASSSGGGLAGLQAVGAELLNWGSLRAALASTWSVEVFAVYCCYWLALALLYIVLPGPRVEGTLLRDGRRLEYPLNGLLSLGLVLAAAAGVQVYKPAGYDLTWIWDNTAQLAVANIIFSFLLSVYLYAYSFRAKDYGSGAKPLLAEGGNSGHTVYDFFIGRELNPRALWGCIDLKYFCELRPGLTQWLLMNLAAAAHQHKTLGAVTPGMVLVLLFQGYYVLDSVLNEAAILSTMDITTDGFGWMLAFGDLAWVPGTYGLQARFLATATTAQLGFAASWWWLAVTAAVGLGGMVVFRGANSQKDAFKRDPTALEFKGITTIPTATGSKLLAGGWWGVARHINYAGDWAMSVAWCLPCGLTAASHGFLTYFYPLYFAVLLIHRDARDEEKCAHKYGAAWEEYCRRVPYRIVPGVY